jgi:hypothetical protein
MVGRQLNVAGMRRATGVPGVAPEGEEVVLALDAAFAGKSFESADQADSYRKLTCVGIDIFPASFQFSPCGSVRDSRRQVASSTPGLPAATCRLSSNGDSIDSTGHSGRSSCLIGSKAPFHWSLSGYALLHGRNLVQHIGRMTTLLDHPRRDDTGGRSRGPFDGLQSSR